MPAAQRLYLLHRLDRGCVFACVQGLIFYFRCAMHLFALTCTLLHLASAGTFVQYPKVYSCRREWWKSGARRLSDGSWATVSSYCLIASCTLIPRSPRRRCYRFHVFAFSAGPDEYQTWHHQSPNVAFHACTKKTCSSVNLKRTISYRSTIVFSSSARLSLQVCVFGCDE